MTPTQLRITLTEDELARWNALRHWAGSDPLTMEHATALLNKAPREAQTAMLARIRV